jgi:hypothetical protein
MNAVTADSLFRFASTMRSQTLHTEKRGAAFSVDVHFDKLLFTPESTGKTRPERRSNLVSVREQFNRSQSLNPGDYQKQTRNASYILALIAEFIADQDENRARSV